jgi:hypothetical protein
MKAKIKFRYEQLDERSARIWAELFVDGVHTLDNVLVSGQIGDVQRLYDGEITFPQYQQLVSSRNSRLVRLRTRAVEQNAANLGRPRRAHA